MKSQIEKERLNATAYLSTLKEKEKESLKLYIACINPLIKEIKYNDIEKCCTFGEFAKKVLNAFAGIALEDINQFVLNRSNAMSMFSDFKNLKDKEKSIQVGNSIWNELNGGNKLSTRSMICKEVEPNKYVGVYCHSDGYLTYNGAMLIDHYNTRERVDKLISLGDISTLQENIEPDRCGEHSFDNRQDGVSVFYGRDRGEKGTEAREVKLEDIDNPDSWIEYCYIYGLDNKWKYIICGHLKDEGIKSVQEGLDNEFQELGFSRPSNVYGFFTEEDVKFFKNIEKQKNAEQEM